MPPGLGEHLHEVRARKKKVTPRAWAAVTNNVYRFFPMQRRSASAQHSLAICQ